ncbi:tRNA uridine-5-carboxymethylaminomethyl(34) synthesis GTPase MnmE [Jannaschia sp. S6380]|uniref:tRNA uridine-5-carboxymethylaminomethyl(34) synthesis GTPase MnmE n=1 Tax=Jannaschia sp. S6380 TaxID=2926408 RepID=UPI001FF33292|nr:tRNA uridine-5-carboxymethylaminomethyl(34) synthesis GTPase MnmE [Jannaschia sp. S6380]MCK0168445.1 tRNA uridine-5-carboxymethylaminomethyl(34) synthesis GTPase MnmE [Jannaschia sp. S6380]
MDGTIYAVATAPGKAGVAIIRISGPSARAVLSALGAAAPAPRTTRLATLRSQAGEVLDHALVLFFEAGASFTGEDVVELHLHGSPAGVRRVMSEIGGTGVARLAEPGEFTRRALLNDRLDLTQVQALADVIDADTEEQHRHAMRILEGDLARKVEAWRKDLIRAIALIEATIDFADEDVPTDVTPEVQSLIRSVSASVATELRGVAAADRIRAGFDVAIVGAPNVGKSSLLNSLTRSDSAIVSDIAGTTRDVIEIRLDIGGVQVNLIDTAGLRDTTDAVERLGVQRAVDRARNADLRLFLFDDKGLPDLGVAPLSDDIVIRTKVDLDGVEGISTLDGTGIEALLSRIGERAMGSARSAGLVSRDRDRETLAFAVGELERLAKQVGDLEPEVLSADLRIVVRRLHRIIGGVEVEEILDEIFASFCLGK